MKQLNVCITVLVSCLTLPFFAHAAVTDKIAAVVNDEIITLYELNEAFSPIQKKIDATYKGQDKDKLVAETKLTFLNRIIEGSLVEQEAKKSGIVIKDEEVADAIKNILSNRNINKEEFVKILENEGTTLDAYSKDLKTQLRRMRLVRREINAKVAVGDEEIGEYYSKHRDFFEGKEAVSIKQILLQFPPKADAEVKARLKADAEMILKQLKSGESFDLLAAKYSNGPAASSGGDIGFIERGLMLPAVEDVAFSLAVGEISNIIETPIGFHIIKVIDKKGAGIKSIESVRDEIKEKILEEKSEKRYEGWIQELKKKSHIEIRI